MTPRAPLLLTLALTVLALLLALLALLSLLALAGLLLPLLLSGRLAAAGAHLLFEAFAELALLVGEPASGFSLGPDTGTDFFALDNLAFENGLVNNLLNTPEPATRTRVEKAKPVAWAEREPGMSSVKMGTWWTRSQNSAHLI